MSILKGVAGTTVGALVGGIAGMGVHNLISPLDSHIGNVGYLFIYGAALSPFGTAAAIWWHGDSNGHNGSYWAAVAGSYAGLLTSAGAFYLLATAGGASGNEDLGGGFVIAGAVSALVLPAVFGTLAYTMSLEPGEAPPPPTGGLIDLQGDSFSLGLPEVSLGFGAGGVDRVNLRLIGARF
jgi:hypothetical protein